ASENHAAAAKADGFFSWPDYNGRMRLSEKIIESPQPSAAQQEQIVRLEGVTMGDLAGQEELKDITLSIARGGFHFLCGPSGAGRWALLNVVGWSVRPTRGKIELFGTETTELSRHDLPPLRRRVGMVFQDYRLVDHLTVGENVGLPLKIAGESKKMIAEK